MQNDTHIEWKVAHICTHTHMQSTDLPFFGSEVAASVVTTQVVKSCIAAQNMVKLGVERRRRRRRRKNTTNITAHQKGKRKGRDPPVRM